jgi:hypothetical protein
MPWLSFQPVTTRLPSSTLPWQLRQVLGQSGIPSKVNENVASRLRRLTPSTCFGAICRVFVDFVEKTPLFLPKKAIISRINLPASLLQESPTGS